MVENTFSVVVPSVGRHELLRTVQSVASQTLQPVEVLVVMNSRGEGEPNPLQISDASDPLDVQTIYLPPHSGPAIARNVGAWHAIGKYVAFIDDDDWIASDYLEQVNLSLVLRSAPVVYSAMVWHSLDVRNNSRREIGAHPPDRWLQRLLGGRNCGFGAGNMVVERDFFFRLGGFPTSMRTDEDTAFAVKVLRSGACVNNAYRAELYRSRVGDYNVNSDPFKWLSKVAIVAEHWDIMDRRTKVEAAWRIAKSLPFLNVRRGDSKVR